MDPLNITSPPSITRTADKRDELLRAGKQALAGVSKCAMEAGRFFQLCRDMCEPGEWLKLLDRNGISARTAQWAIKKYKDGLSPTIAHLDDLLSEDREIEEGQEVIVYEPPPPPKPRVDRHPKTEAILKAQKLWENLSRACDSCRDFVGGGSAHSEVQDAIDNAYEVWKRWTDADAVE